MNGGTAASNKGELHRHKIQNTIASYPTGILVFRDSIKFLSEWGCIQVGDALLKRKCMRKIVNANFRQVLHKLSFKHSYITYVNYKIITIFVNKQYKFQKVYKYRKLVVEFFI